MWFHGYFLLVVCWIGGFSHEILPLASEKTDIDCETECSNQGSGPVCGTDGRTYDSVCDIDMAKCQGHPVEFKNFGTCPERARCEAQRALLMKQGNQMFVPECNADGSYAEVQCHKSTGYCWCADKDGKPVRGSSVKQRRPNCSSTGRRPSNRRRTSRGRRQKKGCNSSDRATFNANLIDIFESEFNRLEEPPLTTSAGEEVDPLTDTHEKAVVQWKFNQLDENGDNYLKKPEVRDLRRMAKKIVKPKACAKTFAKYCDLDSDKKISRSEWSVCVGVHITNEEVNTMDQVLEDAPAVNDHHAANPSSRSLSIRPELWDSQRQHLKHDGRLNAGKSVSSVDTDEKEEEIQDCETARRAALENHRQDPAAGIYIPECNKEGFYMRAQCHKSQRFCWCVHVRTGKPLRGTTTLGVKPDCESAKSSTRHFKGCSFQKKQDFLDELVQSFVQEVIEDAKNRSVSVEIPTHEKAARWKFSYIDSNSNEVLDKREWKVFKKEWQSFHKDSRQKKRLRKCWRNLPRFCDENNNQKITMDEWLMCTGITRDFKASPAVTPGKRRGQNPFSTILKSD